MNLKFSLMAFMALAMIFTSSTVFAKHHAAVFTVFPTGADDTANLQAAFDAAILAGHGSTVQLVRGTYYIRNGIVAVNFEGSSVGAGKEKTFVQNLGPFATDDYFLTFSPEGQNVMPGLITISDLTFRAIGPAETDVEFFKDPMNAFQILHLKGDSTGKLNAYIIRVGFEGESGDLHTPWGRNIHNSSLFSSGDNFEPLSGNVLFQDCTFKNALSGVSVMLHDAHFRVEGCTFTDILSPIGAWGITDSTADILRNRVHMGAPWNPAVYIGNFEPGGDSTVRISHNDISVSSVTDAIRIEDFGSLGQDGVPTIKHTVISDNEIRVEGEYSGAIGGAYVSNVLIADNTIYGHGRLGIYTGNTAASWWDFYGDDFSPAASNWVIVGNNLKHADTLYKPILLGPNSSHCLVKADANDVDNQGTDNTIIYVYPGRRFRNPADR
jgi:hypothetical protein